MGLRVWIAHMDNECLGVHTQFRPIQSAGGSISSVSLSNIAAMVLDQHAERILHGVDCAHLVSTRARRPYASSCAIATMTSGPCPRALRTFARALRRTRR